MVNGWGKVLKGKGLDAVDDEFKALARRVCALEESYERVRESCVPRRYVERLGEDVRALVDDLMKAIRGH